MRAVDLKFETKCKLFEMGGMPVLVVARLQVPAIRGIMGNYFACIRCNFRTSHLEIFSTWSRLFLM